MTEQVELASGLDRDGRREGFSAWWWLALPVVVGLLLAVTAKAAPGFYAVWIESEQGLLEISHILLPAAGLLLALQILIKTDFSGRGWLRLWVGFAALACFYIAGEEASWGQHFFGWATPEGWQKINDQQETNLHNVSAWLDQKPRLLLELGVIVGGIVIPLAALWRPALRRHAFGIILPPFLTLPSAVLAELSRATERVAEALGHSSILFQRASEVQEFYFFLFVLFYLIVLRQRLRAGVESP